MKLLYVQFDDPYSMDEWLSKEDIKEEATGLKHTGNEAVGWLVYEDKKIITISSHKACCNKYCAFLTIPKLIITKKKILRV